MSKSLFARVPLIKGRGLHIRVPVAERVRAAMGMRQAVVKVRSFGRGIQGVRQSMDYISREGKLPLETESGEMVNDREELRELVKDWAVDFDDRANSRDSAHIIFSMPPGSDPEALRRAIRTVGAKAFPDHEWVFAIHQDKNHPHAHMVLKMCGRDQDLKLDFKKADLHELRSIFAEAAREQGVPLAASSRAMRGVGQKAMSQAICQMRDKNIVPRVWKEAYREACMERDITADRPWEKAMEDRNQAERAAYVEDARGLRAAAAAQADLNQRQVLLHSAAALERFSRTMPKPKTRRQAWLEQSRTASKMRSEPSKRQKESGWER